MTWRETLSKFKDKLVQKRKDDELRKVEWTQLKKEDKRIRAEINKNIFHQVQEVFMEFVKAIYIDKQWKKAVVKKERWKTGFYITITREYIGSGPDSVHETEWISVSFPDYPFQDYNKRSNCNVNMVRGSYPDELPRELLSKYEAKDPYECKTSIKIDNFSKEKLAEILKDFFTPSSTPFYRL